MRYILIGLFVSVAVGSSPPHQEAKESPPPGSVLLNLAAHPDDEAGAVLAYYGGRFGVRCAIVVATRGEGGQNAIGSESGADLGALRTKEMAEAAEILGADLRFLNLADFGYSKSPEETLRIWGGEAALERLVRAIREIAPDVIVTNHNPETGHGHHRALALLALEAFRSAANPEVFPDQLEDGLRPHQPLRLYIGVDDPSEGVVSVPVGERLAPTGRTAMEIALKAVRRHRSQGPWEGVLERWGERIPRFRLAGSAGPRADGVGLFGGIPRRPDWAKGYWETEDADRLISRGGLELLAEAVARMAATAQTPDLHPAQARWLGRRSEIAESFLWERLDLLNDLRVEPELAFAGGEAKAILTLQNAGNHPIEIDSIRFEADGIRREIERRHILEPGARSTTKATLDLPTEFPPTVPLPETIYLRLKMEPLLEVRLRYRAFGRTLLHRWRARLEVVPPISITVDRRDQILPISAGSAPRSVAIAITNRTGEEARGEFRVDVPPGFVGPPPRSIAIPPGRTEIQVDARAASRVPAGRHRFGVRLRIGDFAWNQEFHITGADLQFDQEMKVLLIEGVDRTVEAYLRDIGVGEISTDAEEDLAPFDAIVVGVRAAATRDGMKELDARLDEYVREGGHLLVLYHKITEWEGGAPFAPYPLPIGRDRVTDETVPVRVLGAGHPILLAPNRIGPSDWNGWIQERGLYFPRDYSEEYEEIVSIRDGTEVPLRGGILHARYGKGTYTYTTLVWHRQVAGGHAGAARILANLITPPAARR